MKIDSQKYPLPKRLRHHTASNLYLPFKDLPTKPDYYPPLIDSVNWSDFYSNSNEPVIFDVGCGKGAFLLDYAETRTDKNFLGIELRLNVVSWLESVIKGYELPNVAVLWYSVVNGLPFIKNDSVEEIFYLFPDPWFKKKHNKRRAFNEESLAEYHRILKPGFSLYLATDVAEVHEHHLAVLEAKQLFSVKEVRTESDWPFPVTNKEKFCLAKNIETYKLICTK